MARSGRPGPPPARPASAAPPPQTDEFSQEIAKRVGALVGRDKAAQVTAQIISVVSERFSGPIAHPRHLREYEEICPGSADRIIQMAEGNLAHTQNLQDKALDGEIKDRRDGRLYGFLALALLIIGAIIAGYMKNTTLAVTFLGAGALGTVGAIIKGARSS